MERIEPGGSRRRARPFLRPFLRPIRPAPRFGVRCLCKGAMHLGAAVSADSEEGISEMRKEAVAKIFAIGAVLALGAVPAALAEQPADPGSQGHGHGHAYGHGKTHGKSGAK